MQFDIISVFPEFFRVLDLSLVGKAQESGLISIAAHNLRDWTHDVHRTVDDSPCGGGAGMVMKPDVWAEAIDCVTMRNVEVDSAVLGGTIVDATTDSDVPAGQMCNAEVGGSEMIGSAPFVLALPTPSGPQLTQGMCTRLAQETKHIVIACGRYEGIDARVAEYYRSQPGVAVMEYSLGDYVLNGGEVAAVALIEAVSRLLPGMVGNPESLVEESHGEAGLLEYPVYTRPLDFRGIRVPSVLTSGNHAAVAHWRKEQAFARTALYRPDMLFHVDTVRLSKKEIACAAQHHFFVQKNSAGGRNEGFTFIRIRRALPEDAAMLSSLASRTFPDAAPPSLACEDIQAFISENLQAKNFEELLAVPDKHMLVVAQLCDRAGAPTAELVGYTWVIVPDGDQAAGEDEGALVDFVTADGVSREGPLMYLEKAYVDREWRGSGLFKQMMKETIAMLREHLARRTPIPPAPYLWLGVNSENRRAQRAYSSCGFERSGRRTFPVGDQINKDITMCLRVDMAQ